MNYEKIARLAHVSVSTVSKALSGSKEVRDDLAEQIVDIAMRVGYFEEKNKRTIYYANEKKALSVAIVCPEIISVEYAREITAVKTAAEKRGAVVAVYVYDFNADSLKKIIKTLTVRNGANGIVLYPHRDVIPETTIPIVTISQPLDSYDGVSCDIDRCFGEIIAHLKMLGHQRIAFVGERLTTSKRASFRKCMEAAGLPCNECDIYTISERFEQIGYVAAEQMMRTALPTAVVCAYDEIALAMIHRFEISGISVPGDISVVGINDIPPAAYAQIPLTTVRTCQDDQGEIVIRLLYDKIFGKSQAIQHISVSPKLIPRKSTDKPRIR